MPERVGDRPLSAIGALLYLIQDSYGEGVLASGGWVWLVGIGGPAPSRSRLGNGAARKRSGSETARFGNGAARKRRGSVRVAVRCGSREGGALQPHRVGDGVELDGEGVFEIFPLGGIEDLLDGVGT